MHVRRCAAAGVALVIGLVGCSGSTVDDGSHETIPEAEPRPAEATVPASAVEPWSGPTVIIDTDLSLWWDDATALGMANVLVQRDELRLLGVVSDVPNHLAVTAIDAINTAYGHPDIPVGAMAGSDVDSFPHGYTDALVERLPHSGDRSGDVPEAVGLYRDLLVAAPRDRSVTIVAIGGYSNLAGLLESGPDEVSELTGRELIASRVDRLVIMDGLFPDGGPPLTNQEIDPAAAAAVVAGDWPTAIAWVDGFSGIGTLVGASLCSDAPADHPMRIVYEELFACEPPGDGNWDAPTLLYAIGDLDHAFEEHGHGGAATINEAGGLRWELESARDGDVYVRVVDQESLNERVEELITSG